LVWIAGIAIRPWKCLPRRDACNGDLHDLSSQIWTNSSMLDPCARAIAALKRFLDARERCADFVYFNHSIHVAKGVGCTTCHGPIAEMNITWRGQTLYMRWCLECHNAPENYLRPRARSVQCVLPAAQRQLALGRPAYEGIQSAEADELHDVSPLRRTGCGLYLEPTRKLMAAQKKKRARPDVPSRRFGTQRPRENTPRFWRSLEELADTPEFPKPCGERVSSRGQRSRRYRWTGAELLK